MHPRTLHTMEVLKNAIWGDSTSEAAKEPVSGETGSGTATDPHDRGNLEGINLSNLAPVTALRSLRCAKPVAVIILKVH